ncbi:MAG: tetratricopeptide repeat protein [Treponema sp.]|jgi:tetratricopeptide (TPR) repeat protein|nr:tetratricopeptide repeat protein [Treponema sp.]
MTVTEYYQQGVKLKQQKDYDRAIELFTTALDEYPDSTMIIGIRGSTYYNKGEKEKALADYTRLIDLMPERPDGWNSRGNLYHELGEYDKAIADYTHCIPMSPDNYGTYWSNRGISYCAKGDLDAALADFNQSIACWTEPECSGWALYHRGVVWRKKGDLDKALADFRLAAKYSSYNADIPYQAGYVWFMRRNFKKAIRYFSKAIKARGNVADHWLARGASYWNQCVKDKTAFWGKDGEIMDLAEDDFTRAIECDPAMAIAYLDRGMVRCTRARESNNCIKAILTQKATDDAERAVLLAQLEHIGGKDLVPQTDAFLRGLRSNQDEVDVIMSNMLGLFAEEGARGAVEDLSQAVALDPDNADAWYERGLAYTLLGEKDKALADYERTCALDPFHSKAAEKRDKLLESRK